MPTKVQVRVKPKDEENVTPNDGAVPSVIDLRTSPGQDEPVSAQAPQQTPEAPYPSQPSYDEGRSRGGYGQRPPRRDFQNRDFNEDEGRDVPTIEVGGILDVAQDGHGFLRPKFRPSDQDVYISSSQIRRFMLRGGDSVNGIGRPPKESERYFGLLKVVEVNGFNAEK